ncbi:MAG: hypothetical protein K2O63_03465 [Alistipes sp.]|nr:hypothetical protein [Alistipes sp.]
MRIGKKTEIAATLFSLRAGGDPIAVVGGSCGSRHGASCLGISTVERLCAREEGLRPEDEQ